MKAVIGVALADNPQFFSEALGWSEEKDRKNRHVCELTRTLADIYPEESILQLQRRAAKALEDL